MVKTLADEGKLSAQDLEDMNFRIDRFESRLHKYIGHLIRGAWEINNKNRLKCTLHRSQHPIPPYPFASGYSGICRWVK